MGEATGFLRWSRATPTRRPVPVRLRDWREVYEPFDKGALKECGGILIFARRFSCAHRGDVGGKLGLQKRAFEHIAMGYGDLAPGAEGGHEGASDPLGYYLVRYLISGCSYRIPRHPDGLRRIP